MSAVTIMLTLLTVAYLSCCYGKEGENSGLNVDCQLPKLPLDIYLILMAIISFLASCLKLNSDNEPLKSSGEEISF